jgi:riboflavin biosynthesis pyrimidine reductase
MVASIDGKVTIEGTEQGIGSKVDQRLMRELRIHADVVLDGAATVRKSGASPRLNDPLLDRLRIERGKATRMPIIATVTNTGDLPLDRMFFTSPEFNAVVYTGSRVPKDKMEALRATRRTIIPVPDEGCGEAILRHMRQELGAELLLLEGGPTTNRMMFDIDAVDEMFVSVGPVIVGGREGLSAVAGDVPYTRDEVRHMELVHAVPNDDTNEVYLRYRRIRD